MSVIIPAWNQFEYTRQCVESVRLYTPEPHEIIVIDNGSADETASWLSRQTDVRAITNGENLGYAIACNQGLRAARGNYLVLLNNDTVVTPDWSARLIAVLERHPHAGLVGPTANRVGGFQMDDSTSYEDLEGLLAHAATVAQERAGICDDVSVLSGFCWMLSRATYEAVGELDERFGLGIFEDNDYCKRVMLAGGRLLVARDVFIHHQCSVTFQAAGIDYREQTARNKKLFWEKWRDDPALAGREAYEAGDYATAAELFRRAASQSPTYADAHSNLAAACMRLGRWSEAASALEKLCELRPLHWRSRIELAKAYRRLGRPMAAAGEIEPVLQQPHLSPVLRAQALLVAGDSASAVEEWETAERAYQAAWRTDPELAGAVNGLGVIAARRGDVATAREAFERAAALDAAAPDPLSNLGVLLWQSGDREQAMAQFTAALERDPVHGDALENFVAVALDAGRLDTARDRVERALACDPDWDVAREMLAQCQPVSA